MSELDRAQPHSLQVVDRDGARRAASPRSGGAMAWGSPKTHDVEVEHELGVAGRHIQDLEPGE